MDLMDRLGMGPQATCVEAVLPNPVSGFAAEKLKGVLGSGSSDVVENTGRFGFISSLNIFLHPDSRVMRTSRVVYPYWENAARVAENRCGMYAAAIILLLAFPSAVCVYWLFCGLAWLRKKGRELLRKRK